MRLTSEFGATRRRNLKRITTTVPVETLCPICDYGTHDVLCTVVLWYAPEPRLRLLRERVVVVAVIRRDLGAELGLADQRLTTRLTDARSSMDALVLLQDPTLFAAPAIDGAPIPL